MTEKTALPIFDGHNDVLLSLRETGRSFFDLGQQGHIDLPRACAGGLAGGFCAVFVPSEGRRLDPTGTNASASADPGASADEESMLPTPELGYSIRSAMAQMALLWRIEAESNGRVRVVRNTAGLSGCLDAGAFAAILHLEGAEAIDPELAALDVYFRAGLRSLGPVWSRPNRFGNGVPFTFPSTPDTGPGLTENGRDLVRACNRLGVMIDLSHLTEAGFWDVAGLSDAPLVATHSNAHALSPSARNLTDRQLAAIKESDGIVGVNFHVGFLREDGRRDPDTPLDVVVRHVDYLVERLGIERVGFGSDFDGATMPNSIKDASGLPNLVAALRRQGYDEPSLRKLAHENWIRVLARTWKDPVTPER